MPSSPVPHVANFVSMNPNKRGPVELGMATVGREWVRRGGKFSLYYLEEPPEWYRIMLQDAGITHGTVGLNTWHEDILGVCGRVQPDIVHLHMGRHTMAPALKRAGIRILRTEHSDRQPQHFEALRRLARWYGQRDLETFICVSEFLARQTQRDFLVPPTRTRVVYNGCDLERFRPRPEDRATLRKDLLQAEESDVVFTVAAHLIPRKQQHMLIRAMPTVLTQAPQARLVIAGNGPMLGELRTLTRDLDVGRAVTFLTGDNDVALLYAASDVGALTSAAEGLGGSAVEAQACGLPLIATSVDGLAETFVDGKTGIAVKSDETSIAEAMIRLALAPALRAQMGAAAVEFVRGRFHPQHQAELMCSIYEEISRCAHSK